MPATTELVGQQKIQNDLRMLMDRLVTPAKVLELEFLVLEEAEESIFEAHGGRYRDTDRLYDSLTQTDASDAIRRLVGVEGIGGLEFGTSVWYAKFQRNIGGPSGKPRGRKRVGPNQVLRLTPEVRRSAAAAIREYLYGGLGE